jgi:hypothetical protein
VSISEVVASERYDIVNGRDQQTHNIREHAPFSWRYNTTLHSMNNHWRLTTNKEGALAGVILSNGTDADHVQRTSKRRKVSRMLVLVRPYAICYMVGKVRGTR